LTQKYKDGITIIKEKTMDDIDFSDIPEKCKNNGFAASDIKWIKNVNDPHVHYAYLIPDKRVRINSYGVFFCLEANDLYEKSLGSVPEGDIILIYQKLERQDKRYFTHLVTPVRDDVIPSPYDGAIPEWVGRWVKVIAMTDNKERYSIPLIVTEWQKMGFTPTHHRLEYQDGSVRNIDRNQQISGEQLKKLQENIWDEFRDFGEKGKKNK
jgi:hypothetical protein